MEWLNYHHLLYFWTVAKEGTIAKACEKLRLSQPTISGQIRLLEGALGEKLFRKSGRQLRLTKFGETVYRYANEIFSVGREMMETVRGRSGGEGNHPLRFHVGVTDDLPKLMTYRLLAPALKIKQPVRVVCREDKAEKLLADLATHELDVVITDEPFHPEIRVRAFNHFLGECSVAFFGEPALAQKYRRHFPKSLHGAPVILPTINTAMRKSLDRWFDSQGIEPHIAGEFEDSALLKVFGQAAIGLFPAPSAVKDDVCQQYGVRSIGSVEVVRQRFYAISVERRIKHPAVAAISEGAHHNLLHC